MASAPLEPQVGVQPTGATAPISELQEKVELAAAQVKVSASLCECSRFGGRGLDDKPTLMVLRRRPQTLSTGRDA